MKSVVNSKKQEQYRKFMAKDASFLKKVVGGDNANATDAKSEDSKIKI